MKMSPESRFMRKYVRNILKRYHQTTLETIDDEQDEISIVTSII